MNIPKFWAHADAEVETRDRRSILLRKWHWSDRSTEDAAGKARGHLETAVARVRAGEPLGRGYYTTEQPLREETIREIPGTSGSTAAIITRNAYGSLVLNTDRMVFIDIDFPEQPTARAAASTGGLMGLVGRLFGGGINAPATPATSPEADALQQIEDQLHRTGGGYRAYRTASGLRLMGNISPHEAPDDPATLAQMKALGCDPLYLKLCKAQKCFRARLTPKPWRVGLAPATWRYPYQASAESSIRKWLQEYESRSNGFATCRYLKDVGASAPKPSDELVQLHDQFTRAGESNLPLA